jgi:hypothetical protein
MQLLLRRDDTARSVESSPHFDVFKEGGTTATEFVATFNRAESSNFAEVRMRVRQACEGRVIEARSSELKDGGWDCEFSIEEHEATGVTETLFYVPGVFLRQRQRLKRQ